ncbi:MAG: hypothetical protein ABIY55_21570 [Kofleriaceae bacterium]
MLRTLTLAVSLTMLFACAKGDQPGPAKPAPAKPATSAATPGGNSELENKGIAMMQRMGEVFAADAADCEKLAVDIKAFIVQNRELLGQLNELERSQSDQEKSAFETRNKPVQEAVVAKMDPAMEKCGQNPSVQAAMKDFPSE